VKNLQPNGRPQSTPVTKLRLN